MIEPDTLKYAAELLDVDLATVQAVVDVESRNRAFLPTGEPVILFERHVFHRLTKGKYSLSHPHISNPTAGGYGKYSQQHGRLQEAAALDRESALKSTSWGAFQIMGFNYKEAGFFTLQSFINAMYRSEDEQLLAFVKFIINNGLQPLLKQKQWAEFAHRYNGPAYKRNQYDTKLAAAYKKYARPA